MAHLRRGVAFVALSFSAFSVCTPGCSKSPPGTDAGTSSFGTDSALAGRLDVPAVSFRGDVLPVLEQSCAFPSCHGSRTASHGVFLGKGAPAEVLASVVRVKSGRYEGQTFVVPFEPARSFLLRKVDGRLTGLACGKSCGDPMPKKSAALPIESRLVLARWIAQGARSD